MKFLVQAPWPALQTTLVTPSPSLGNNKNLASTVQTIRAMDGTVYTYVKSKRGRKVFSWDFLATREKTLEVKEFVRLYAGSVVLVTDHNGDKFRGYMTMNPLELKGEGRAGGYPSGEVYRYTLQLEELV